MTAEKRAYNKLWRERNHEYLREYERNRVRNQDGEYQKSRAAYYREWYRRNAARIKQRAAAGYKQLKADPAAYAYHLAKQAQNARKRPDLRRAREKRCRDNRHDVYKLKRSRRKARLRGAAGSFNDAQWKARFDFYGGRCAYCLIEVTLESAHVDHVIPVADGGSNWPSNLVPACCSCNCGKRASRWLPKWLTH